MNLDTTTDVPTHPHLVSVIRIVQESLAHPDREVCLPHFYPAYTQEYIIERENVALANISLCWTAGTAMWSFIRDRVYYVEGAYVELSHNVNQKLIDLSLVCSIT